MENDRQCTCSGPGLTFGSRAVGVGMHGSASYICVELPRLMNTGTTTGPDRTGSCRSTSAIDFDRLDDQQLQSSCNQDVFSWIAGCLDANIKFAICHLLIATCLQSDFVGFAACKPVERSMIA